MNTKIKKIVIKMGKKDVDLTLEEAKELQELLNDTFGKEKEVRVIERVFERPYQRWHPYYYSGGLSVSYKDTPNPNIAFQTDSVTNKSSYSDGTMVLELKSKEQL